MRFISIVLGIALLLYGVHEVVLQPIFSLQNTMFPIYVQHLVLAGSALAITIFVHLGFVYFKDHVGFIFLGFLTLKFIAAYVVLTTYEVLDNEVLQTEKIVFLTLYMFYLFLILGITIKRLNNQSW